MASREQDLAHALVSLADNLVKDFDVVDLFYELVEVSTELLPVDQAGLLLAAPDGDLRVMAVTNESAGVVELLQLASDEAGPCVEAYRTGEFVEESLAGESATRWLDSTQQARLQEFGHLSVFPLRLHDYTIGTLNLFRSSERAMTEDDVVAARAMADIATIAIIQERAAKEKNTLVDQLERALDSRIAIEQAKGVIVGATGLPPDRAFERLRSYARSNNLRLREVAHQVATGALETGLL